MNEDNDSKYALKTVYAQNKKIKTVFLIKNFMLRQLISWSSDPKPHKVTCDKRHLSRFHNFAKAITVLCYASSLTAIQFAILTSDDYAL